MRQKEKAAVLGDLFRKRQRTAFFWGYTVTRLLIALAWSGPDMAVDLNGLRPRFASAAHLARLL